MAAQSTLTPRRSVSSRSRLLYLASTNHGKLREFKAAAVSQGWQVAPLPSIKQITPCPEDGATFEENARKKALYYSAHTRHIVFADDSGLAVDALAGAPGVHSARFAGLGATDAANNAKLLDELARVQKGHTPRIAKGANRCAAHYICVIALAERGTILAVTEGRADGIILDAPRGRGGFGYDPYFLYPPLGRTFAELEPEAKFAVSHRGHAFRRLLEFLAHAS